MATTHESTHSTLTQPIVSNTVDFESSKLLNVESTPFFPRFPAPVRDIHDILRDHSEVEKVVKGGVGTSVPVVDFLFDG